jgi:hypothetical protein
MIKGMDPRIAIIGAGPAGILTAYYLKERGYSNVIVLEKLGRVGGKARTMTVDGRSFDLGANYITPAYKEIRKLAKKIGATMYSERPFLSMSIPDDPTASATYTSMFKSSRFDDKTQTEVGILPFMWATLRYAWIRRRLSSFIDKPTFEGVESYDDGKLACTLEEWLQDNQLTALRRVMELPSTLMGYGYVDKIAAIYILKFMSNKTFLPMMLKEMPFIGKFYWWPKRFVYGYQRFFEKLSWDLDVRFNVDIEKIERSDDLVTIKYNKLEQDLDDTASPEGTLIFDYLIMACPLNLSVSEHLLDLREDERKQFHPIKVNSYCMSTFMATLGDSGGGVSGGSPLAAVYPVPPMDDRFVPYGIARQWDDCDMVQVYTRTEDASQDHPLPGEEPKVENEVMKAAEVVLRQMGAVITPVKWAMRTFNRWPYFQHVLPDVIRDDKWYTKLEKLQGRHLTYYVGGPTNFDLIEPIAEYAKYQVETHFPKIVGSFNWRWWLWRIGIVAIVAWLVIWFIKLPF